MNRDEITRGKKFGLLTVIRHDGRTKSNHSMWLCECECGIVKRIRQPALVTGATVSCGCYRRNMKVGQTHGDSKTRLYNIWNQMRHRCIDENHTSFHCYGGRGIKVCAEWNEYLNFKKWSLNNGYSEQLVIDRKDNNDDYTPDNCRWITQKENSNNTRANRLINIDGITKTMKQWSEISGVNYATLKYRLDHGIREGNQLFDAKSYSHVRERDKNGRFKSLCDTQEKLS